MSVGVGFMYSGIKGDRWQYWLRAARTGQRAMALFGVRRGSLEMLRPFAHRCLRGLETQCTG